MSGERRPGRRPWPTQIPRKRVNAVVVNGRLVDVFDAICALENLRPHELVHEVVREYCERREAEAAVKALVRARRRYQSRLELLP